MTRRRSATSALFGSDDRILPGRSAGCAGHHSEACATPQVSGTGDTGTVDAREPSPELAVSRSSARSATPCSASSFASGGRGLERLPADGGYVLAANHLSNLDPWPLGMALFPRRYLRFMAKSELFWFPLGPFIAACGAFPVRRGAARPGGGRDRGPALPGGAHRRHVPRGHAPREGAAQAARGTLALGCRADRARGGSAARSRRHRGHGRADAASAKLQVAFGDPIELGDLADDAARRRRPCRDRPAQRRDHRARGIAVVKPLLAIDGDSFAHRAFHALPRRSGATTAAPPTR